MRASDVALGGAGRTAGITYFAPERAPTTRGARAEEAGNYQIDFDNAPMATVARSIVTDTLGASLQIDPRVNGTFTLSSGRRLTRTELLAALEGALTANGASLVKDGSGYRIVPSSEAAALSFVDRAGATPGYGISVLPLRNVSAENMQKLVDGFAARLGAVRVDTSRNLLLVQGSAEERRAAIETTSAFDQDWMRDQSVGIFPVSNATPETMIVELQRILDAGEGGSYRGMVQFQPIARMNAVLVVSRNAQALRAASTWIRRLDRADSAATISRVYRVKYGNARQLAALLTEALGGGATASGGDELATNRIGSSGSGATSGSALDSSASPASAFGALSKPTGQRDAGSTLGSSASTGRSDDVAKGAGKGPNGISITADANTPSLQIFADRERLAMIERVLTQLDRPRLQVAIEATIAEVSLNEDLQYGVQYFLKSPDIGGQADKGAAGFTTTANAIIGRVLPGANFLLGPQAG